MITLNIDRKETAFVIADTPMKLSNKTTDVVAWANGTDAGTNGADGLTTRSGDVAIYYPSGLSTDLNGNDVAVPASHAVLRGYAYNDQVAYAWFAPAGLTRGALSGISNLGTVNTENEFVPLALNQGQRDALYAKNVNPLVNFPGQGLYIWGQKTLYPSSSALDRVNVGRLLAYLRERFDYIARPFIFEPNDKRTRDRVLAVFNGFLADLFTKRAVYDFLVVCDETNNTPARIDRNELYIDIAIEPVKAIEFIYIPVRVVNTGAIANNTK
jgi:phage tail sheath protein FI